MKQKSRLTGRRFLISFGPDDPGLEVEIVGWFEEFDVIFYVGRFNDGKKAQQIYIPVDSMGWLIPKSRRKKLRVIKL